MSKIATSLTLVALAAAWAGPAWAQGRGNEGKPQGPKGHEAKPSVTVDVAVLAAKEVLSKQGFEVLRVEIQEGRHIVYYRAGNRGRGRGQGPPARLVLRQVDERVVLEDAPDAVRLEIGIKLGISL